MTGVTWADCAGRQRVFVSNHQQAVVVPAQTVIATQFLPIPVSAYGASYVDSHADYVKLKAEVDALRAEVEALKAGRPAPAPAAPPAGSEDKAVGILRRDCASCHTAPNAKGSFVIFLEDGKLNPNLDEGKAVLNIFKGVMPKGKPPLSDADVEAIMEFFAR